MTHKRGSCIRGFLSSCGACKGGPPLALESVHDGSPKGGMPGPGGLSWCTGNDGFPIARIRCEEENHHAGSG
jgi:hypothetical protein